MSGSGLHVGRLLERFGAAPQHIRLLSGPDAALKPQQRLDYADLIGRAERGTGTGVEAVVELDERPLIYVLRRPLLVPSDFEEEVRSLRQLLACRGGQTYLAVAEHGRLTVHRCVLAPEDEGVLLVRGVDDPSAAGLVRELVDGSLWQPGGDEDSSGVVRRSAGGEERRRTAKTRQAEGRSVHDVLLDSITRVAQKLRASPALEAGAGQDRSGLVLCLVGRALLARFLVDRRILDPEALEPGFRARVGVDPRSSFDTAAAAAATCAWLDDTFDGDLLRLPVGTDYRRAFARIEGADGGFFRTLGRLMRAEVVGGKDDGQLTLQLWNRLDFAHVPVGLLSEVYDDFTHRFDAALARSTSVHFTPAPIADFVLKQALGALATADAADARVLDPSVGAGIFLTIAFRRIYAALWDKRGGGEARRPGASDIKRILCQQLRGFDTNPHALNLAALSLYLTAIELLPERTPLRELKLEGPLKGTVLFDVRSGRPPELGSLVPGAMPDHAAMYDIVVANPPWTAYTGKAGKALDAAAASIADRVIRRAGNGGRPGKGSGSAARRERADTPRGSSGHYRNPDHVPDLPFVWQSTNWAKPGGLLAFVLHARLLFKSTKAGVEARSALFSALTVTGIIDGAAVSEGPGGGVWPGVDAPFCILFATNRPGSPSHPFHYASPLFEGHINRAGRFRLDPNRVHRVTPGEVELRPSLLKTLSKGDALDRSLMRKLAEPYIPGAGPVAMTTVSELLDRHGVTHCSGFQDGKEETWVDAGRLRELGGRELLGTTKTGFVVDAGGLLFFKREGVQWPRDPKIYLPPLLLVREAAKVDEGQPIASVHFGREPVIYSDAFTGYYSRDARLHEALPDLKRTAYVMAYVGAVLSSPLFRYCMLMTSSKYGVERRAWNKFEADGFRLPDPDRLPAEAGRLLTAVVEEALEGKEPDRETLRRAVYAAFGLNNHDLGVMRDALAVGQPTARSRALAIRQPLDSEVEAFAAALETSLAPVVDLAGLRLKVEARLDLREDMRSWVFLDVRDERGAVRRRGIEPRLISKLADEEGCSVVTDSSEGPGFVRIGMLAQGRFWLPSRVPLVADEVLDAVDGWVYA